MQKKFDSGKIDFLGKGRYLVPVSILVVLFGVIEIVFQGLNYGIDFSGGTEIQIQFTKPVDVADVRESVSSLGYEGATIQSFGDSNEVLIRAQTIVGKDDRETNLLQKELTDKITKSLQATFADAEPTVRRVDTVGPQVGDELKRNSLLAAFYCLLMMLVYIGLRFDYEYAPAAVFCLFFDATITLSIIAILGMEVNIQTLASILTLIGYSINDTIVTFDRIRENVKTHRDVPFYDLVNRSINDTLSRTIITSLTTFLAVSALWVFSDGVIEQIAFTLGLGIIIGCYSTIYVASPLVIIAHKVMERRATTRMQTAKA